MKTLYFFLTFFVISNLCHAESTSIQEDLKRVYEKYKNLSEGKNASYIPELAKVDPNLFGIVVVTAEGKTYAIGDVDIPFAIESLSKPFVYALALQDLGEKVIEAKIGLDPTGLPFNSALAVEQLPNHRENPLVNAGAIQITSLIKGKDSANKWERVLDLFASLSNGKPYLGQKIYESETLTNKHNKALAMLLDSYDRMYGDPMDAVDRYTKACSIMMTTKELALMGSTLANNGTNPITCQPIIAPKFVEYILAVMTMNGLYETSGSWWVHVGLPAKSGVGGGILAIAPQKMAIAVFSPPLDAYGNSVRGQKVIEDLSDQWHLNVFFQKTFENKNCTQ